MHVHRLLHQEHINYGVLATALALTCQVARDVGVCDEEVVPLVPILLPHRGLVQNLCHLCTDKG